MITNQNLYYYTASTTGPTQKLPLVLVIPMRYSFHPHPFFSLTYPEVEYVSTSDHRIYCGKRNIIFNFVQHLLYLNFLFLSIPILNFVLTVYLCRVTQLSSFFLPQYLHVLMFFVTSCAP